MTITNGYATLIEYRSFMAMRGLDGASTNDASDDIVIERLIESVSRFIDKETGQRFYTDTNDTAYYYTASNNYIMKLPEFSGITTVAVDYNNVRTYTALASTDWGALPINYSAEGDPITGLEILPTSGAYFPTFFNGIKITGKRGRGSIPDDIRDACLATVMNLNTVRSGQEGQAGRLNITGAGVVIRPTDVPQFAMETIRNYRSVI